MFATVIDAKEDINRLVDHLYRHEAAKLVAVLTRVFGIENLELAEDVVHDSLIEAIKNWPYKGLPENPTAWLYKVARNKTLNILNKEKYKKKYAGKIGQALNYEWETITTPDALFSERGIMDDQLRMIFIACHPSLSKDSQVAFTLKTLCGFSIHEIAHAFFTTDDTINKRLVRARQKIREARIVFEVPFEEMEERLQTVLETIYLLFNEGYSASSGDDIIRYELCEEAIRLARMLASHPALTHKNNVFAILALMLLNASRFAARIDKDGSILTLKEQNRSLWNQRLMQDGFAYLERSTEEKKISVYHILATISAYHCAAPDFVSTDWKGILKMYDHLMLLDSSPLIRLNRSVPLSKVAGVEKAIEELEQLKKDPSFSCYHLLHATEAEFYLELQLYTEAAEAFEKAMEHSSLDAEKELLRKKLRLCLEKLV